jgi:hypothetical protein
VLAQVGIRWPVSLDTFKMLRDDSGVRVERAGALVVHHERSPHASLRALNRTDATVSLSRCRAWTTGDRVLQAAEGFKRVCGAASRVRSIRDVPVDFELSIGRRVLDRAGAAIPRVVCRFELSIGRRVPARTGAAIARILIFCARAKRSTQQNMKGVSN